MKSTTCFNCKYQFKKEPCKACHRNFTYPPQFWEKRNIIDEIVIAIKKIRRNIVG